MKKILFLGSVAAIVLVAAVCMFGVSHATLWQNAKNDYTGGECYVFQISPCDGEDESISCSSTYCQSENGGNTWNCGRKSLDMSRGEYISGAIPVEIGGSGWTSYTTELYYCTIRFDCGNGCSPDSEGVRYCITMHDGWGGGVNEVTKYIHGSTTCRVI